MRRAGWVWVALLILLALAVKGGCLVALDQQVAAWTQAHRTPAVDGVAQAITVFGGMAWMALVSLAMGGFWIARREWRCLTVCAAAGLLGLGLQIGLRLWVAHWRPDAGLTPLTSPDLVARIDQAGFTSGHAFRSAYVFSWLAWLVRAHGAPRWVVPTTIGCVAMILLVGVTRVILNRHWATDVLGAWLVTAIALSVAASRVAPHQRPQPARTG